MHYNISATAGARDIKFAVAEIDGQGSKGALTVAYKIKMEYNMNQ